MNESIKFTDMSTIFLHLYLLFVGIFQFIIVPDQVESPQQPKHGRQSSREVSHVR